MRKPRYIRRAPEVDAVVCNYNGGWGNIRIGDWAGSVMWGTDETGWEHVSVQPDNENITPSWEDMCQLKNIFFEEEECALQIHPPKSQYVNIAENCLHLWRPTDKALRLIFEGGDRSAQN